MRAPRHPPRRHRRVSAAQLHHHPAGQHRRDIADAADAYHHHRPPWRNAAGDADFPQGNALHRRDKRSGALPLARAVRNSPAWLRVPRNGGAERHAGIRREGVKSGGEPAARADCQHQPRPAHAADDDWRLRRDDARHPRRGNAGKHAGDHRRDAAPDEFGQRTAGFQPPSDGRAGAQSRAVPVYRVCAGDYRPREPHGAAKRLSGGVPSGGAGEGNRG